VNAKLTTKELDELRRGPRWLIRRPDEVPTGAMTAGSVADWGLELGPSRWRVRSLAIRTVTRDKVTDLVGQAIGFPSVLTCGCRSDVEGRCRRCLGIDAKERMLLLLDVRGFGSTPDTAVVCIRAELADTL